MQSRRHRTWCGGNPDCEDPSRLCEDLVADYKTAEVLLKKYPTRFRYEKLIFYFYCINTNKIFYVSYIEP